MTGEFAVSNDGIAQAFDLIARSVRQLDAPETAAQRLSVVLDELCSNLIRHDDTLTSDDVFSVHMGRDGDDIVLILSDTGQPFNPFEFKHDRVPDIGGQGINLIKGLCSSVEYSRENGKNKVKVIVSSID